MYWPWPYADSYAPILTTFGTIKLERLDATNPHAVR